MPSFHAINLKHNRFCYKIIPNPNQIMKFLTVAAVCALASSAISIKINHQLRSDQSHEGKPDWAGNGKPEWAGQAKP